MMKMNMKLYLEGCRHYNPDRRQRQHAKTPPAESALRRAAEGIGRSSARQQRQI